MQLSPDTYRAQTSFAEYCRGQKDIQISELNNRAQVYPGLIHNVVNSTLERAYPIAKVVLSKDHWNWLVNEFLKSEYLQSPCLWQMPKGLVQFVRENDYANRFNKPYLEDLLLFEWTEIEVHMMPDINTSQVSLEGNVKSSKLVLNKEYRLLNLAYNVFAPSEQRPFGAEGDYFVLIYRHPETFKVHFIEVSQVCSKCIELLAESYISAEELRQEVRGVDVEGFLSLLLKEQMILGFKLEEGRNND